jgi:uncharacterized protein (DUF1810 family)
VADGEIFEPGSVVIRREVLHEQVWLEQPVKVVEDDGEVLAILVEPGGAAHLPCPPVRPASVLQRHDVARRVGAPARKRSHWMWFLFPQVTGLGSSPTAAHYAIGDRAEAEAFLRDPILGPGYRTLVFAVWRQVIGADTTVRNRFGRPDDQKLVSSLTLLTGIAGDLGDDWAPTVAKAHEVLDRAESQGLPRCPTTQGFLGPDARS